MEASILFQRNKGVIFFSECGVPSCWVEFHHVGWSTNNSADELANSGAKQGVAGGFVCCLSVVFFDVLSLFLVLSSGGYNALIPSFAPPVGGWLFWVFLFPL